jgi:hypothetical protein
MFTFLNTVEVLPTAAVDSIHQFLEEQQLGVPVVLKAKSGKAGHLALHAWIPMGEPMCRMVPTEHVVCAGHATELRCFLEIFAMQVREAVEAAHREAQGAKSEPAAPDTSWTNN